MSNSDPEAIRLASLARLRRATEGLTPEEVEQAVKIASRLLAIRACKTASPRQVATESESQGRTLKVAPPVFDCKVVDYPGDATLHWD